MQHYVPLHPQVIQSIESLLGDRNDKELLFKYNSLVPWVKRQQIPLSRIKGNIVLGDLRKFAEQYGDIIQWDQSNRAYIMTHGVSGIDWKHYKHLAGACLRRLYEVLAKYPAGQLNCR
ncbi:MAG: hypothetical protein MUO70_01490 [Euryarchaeota archaeon]|nr:hypothetical protein [Euryarchaeota archaeon]